ncbi:MAG: BlaI/MecI/CopY family transcriptional regulator [Verrucomicrobiota bacterium]|jgi:BlaI family penicillinase repressor
MSFETKRKSAAKGLPRISDAEWTVLKTVWQLQTPTARDVVEKLKDESDWKPKTIHTLLGRLVQKGALATEKPGREYVFKPLVAERECRLAASRSFLEKVFDGEIAPFLACFLERKKLTRKQIDELKSILEEKTP